MASQPPLCTMCLFYRGADHCGSYRNVDVAATLEIDTRVALVGDREPWVQPRWLAANHMRGHGWLMARLLASCGREGRWWHPK